MLGRQRPGESGEVGELGVGEPKSTGAWLAGAGRDPAPAVAAGADPCVGSERHAARLEELQRRHHALEGGNRPQARIRPIVVPIQDVDAGHRQERRLPAGAAHALGRPSLVRDVDDVRTDDARVGQLDALGVHLEAAQRDGDLDLAEIGIAEVEQLVHRRLETLVVECEVG